MLAVPYGRCVHIVADGQRKILYIAFCAEFLSQTYPFYAFGDEHDSGLGLGFGFGLPKCSCAFTSSARHGVVPVASQRCQIGATKLRSSTKSLILLMAE